MALFLFFEAFFQRLHQLFPAAERFDFFLFFFGEKFLGQRTQPFFGNFRDLRAIEVFQPFKDMTENLIELVEVAFVLHQGCARQKIELIDLHIDDVFIQRIHQRQIFL